jgi:hypothetical protein
MEKKGLICGLLALCIGYANAQTTEKPILKLTENMQLQIGGFVRVEGYWDSRRNLDAVDGLVLFYPLDKKNDANGVDLNDQSMANVSAVASRLWTRFYGPDVLGAKSSAHIEFDFTGNQGATLGLRFRQGWVKLDWGQHELLMGRTWHPLFSTAVMPSVMGLNTGLPFSPFNRSDQVKYTFKLNGLSLSAVAAYQGEYVSFGPEGKSNLYQHRAVTPDLSAVIQYQTGGFTIGAVGNVKTLQPRDTVIKSGKVYQSTEKLTTYSTMFYTQYKTGLLTLKANAMLGQNNYESLMAGGYAVKTKDATTGIETYTPTNHFTTWGNIVYGDKHEFGLFVGYLKNLGTSDNVGGKFYGRGGDIASAYRIAPHYTFTSGRFQFSPEVEYNVFEYGTPDAADKYKVKDTHTISATRILLTVMYNF